MRSMTSVGTVRRSATVVCAALGVAAGAAVATAAPIPEEPHLPEVPVYLGAPAQPQPVLGAEAPQNPFLAANGYAGIHGDGWQSDAYPQPGPLGRDPQVSSLLIPGDLCGSITFDSHGRIVTTCMGASPGLYLIDPAKMEILGKYALPGKPVTEMLNPSVFTNFTGGAYFYLDNVDRAVIDTADGHVQVIAENSTGNGFVLDHDYDASSALQPGESLNSVLPDSTGRLWFVAKTDGVIGTVDPDSGAVHVIRVGQGSDGEISKSFAVGASGEAYVVSDRELFRLHAGPDGAPEIDWRATYPNTGKTKPSQLDPGSGTTPTVLGGGRYVTINDNADPMDVVVYDTADGHQVCAVPVFTAGSSASENSLIGAGNSIVIENNYGYTGPQATLGGRDTAPGFARIDIDDNGTGCHTAWTNTTTAAPSVVSQLSTATGLIYTYTKGSQVTDPWYWTALDFRTGKVVWQRLAGAGPLYNNNYAGIALGPDGAAYVGTLGGMVAIRDRD
ncbi:hypothetical protein ACIRRA_43455 [Nocardia sp. NPDC101769]|uniref:hypothetical protein n=1 Tax=Nocardia sp. NPDC101769 TaxID=3364333 RepID=UPI003819E8FA